MTTLALIVLAVCVAVLLLVAIGLLGGSDRP